LNKDKITYYETNKVSFEKVLVIGGAGFIGSNLVRRLLYDEKNQVTVYDNLSSGKVSVIPSSDRLEFIKGDVLDFPHLKAVMPDHDIVFHLSTNPDTARGLVETDLDLKQGTIGTYNVLESMRITNVKTIVFPSGSGVYGEVGNRLVAEDYGPLFPISMYGATKLASEAMISCFSHAFEMKGYIFRLGNVIGDRLTHGVIFDFIRKLKRDPTKLQVLGSGYQTKPYIHVNDVLDAMFLALQKAKDSVNLYNVATDDWPNVRWIAQTVIREMELRDTHIQYTENDRGWKGDVPLIKLDTTKLKKLGWKCKLSSKEAIISAIRSNLKENLT
jgi:UDP-glucose 4-epimerase